MARINWPPSAGPGWVAVLALESWSCLIASTTSDGVAPCCMTSPVVTARSATPVVTAGCATGSPPTGGRPANADPRTAGCTTGALPRSTAPTSTPPPGAVAETTAVPSGPASGGAPARCAECRPGLAGTVTSGPATAEAPSTAPGACALPTSDCGSGTPARSSDPASDCVSRASAGVVTTLRGGAPPASSPVSTARKAAPASDPGSRPRPAATVGPGVVGTARMGSAIMAPGQTQAVYQSALPPRATRSNAISVKLRAVSWAKSAFDRPRRAAILTGRCGRIGCLARLMTRGAPHGTGTPGGHVWKRKGKGGAAAIVPLLSRPTPDGPGDQSSR